MDSRFKIFGNKILVCEMENVFIDIVKMWKSVYNKEEKDEKNGIKEGRRG